jgi:hypothetical protein
MKTNGMKTIGSGTICGLLLLSMCACNQGTSGDPATDARPVKIKPPPKEFVEKIRALRNFKDFSAPDPIVSLEEFFNGNEDLGSIGCNLTKHPGMGGFYADLKAIRARANVQDVFVAIHELDEETVWPFSECVYILTSARNEEVAKWMEKLQPIEISEGWLYQRPANAPKLKDGMRVVSCWWD